MDLDDRTMGNTVFLKCICGSISISFFGDLRGRDECIKEAKRLGGVNIDTNKRDE
jgi:hypothetical protein